jgi:O-antigen/teichoic acid export membrane protein
MAGVLPAASDLAADGDSTRLQELYFRGTRYLAITDFALCIAGIGLVEPFVRGIWLGAGYDRVVVTMEIILVSYAVWLPSQAMENALMGLGRPEIRMRADIAFLLIHLPLSAFLLWHYGYFGTVVGTAIALVTTRLYVFVAGAHALGTTLVELARFSLVQPAIASVLALGTVLVLRAFLAAPQWVMFVMNIIILGAVYVGYIGSFALDEYDRKLLLSLIHRRATSTAAPR